MSTTRPDCDAPATEILELLGDEYAQQLLQVLNRKAMSARELVDVTDMSRVTVYRRLERLRNAGLIESQTVPDPNGHHHARNWAIVDHIRFRFGAEGISADVRRSDAPDGPLVTPPST